MGQSSNSQRASPDSVPPPPPPSQSNTYQTSNSQHYHHRQQNQPQSNQQQKQISPGSGCNHQQQQQHANRRRSASGGHYGVRDNLGPPPPPPPLPAPPMGLCSGYAQPPPPPPPSAPRFNRFAPSFMHRNYGLPAYSGHHGNYNNANNGGFQTRHPPAFQYPVPNYQLPDYYDKSGNYVGGDGGGSYGSGPYGGPPLPPPNYTPMHHPDSSGFRGPLPPHSDYAYGVPPPPPPPPPPPHLVNEQSAGRHRKRNNHRGDPGHGRLGQHSTYKTPATAAGVQATTTPPIRNSTAEVKPTRTPAPLPRAPPVEALVAKSTSIVTSRPSEDLPTEMPPVEVPPTEAPPTEALPTEAPPTEAPPTKAPPTKAPPTEAPPTEALPTEAPPTKSLPTEAPPTEAPPTKAPPTEAPPTKAPTTKDPTTIAPPTKDPTTKAPLTKAPPTKAPPTKAPLTNIVESYSDYERWSSDSDSSSAIQVESKPLPTQAPNSTPNQQPLVAPQTTTSVLPATPQDPISVAPTTPNIPDSVAPATPQVDTPLSAENPPKPILQYSRVVSPHTGDTSRADPARTIELRQVESSFRPTNQHPPPPTYQRYAARQDSRAPRTHAISERHAYSASRPPRSKPLLETPPFPPYDYYRTHPAYAEFNDNNNAATDPAYIRSHGADHAPAPPDREPQTTPPRYSNAASLEDSPTPVEAASMSYRQRNKPRSNKKFSRKLRVSSSGSVVPTTSQSVPTNPTYPDTSTVTSVVTSVATISVAASVVNRVASNNVWINKSPKRDEVARVPPSYASKTKERLPIKPASYATRQAIQSPNQPSNATNQPSNTTIQPSNTTNSPSQPSNSPTKLSQTTDQQQLQQTQPEDHSLIDSSEEHSKEPNKEQCNEQPIDSDLRKDPSEERNSSVSESKAPKSRITITNENGQTIRIASRPIPKSTIAASVSDQPHHECEPAGTLRTTHYAAHRNEHHTANPPIHKPRARSRALLITHPVTAAQIKADPRPETRRPPQPPPPPAVAESVRPAALVVTAGCRVQPETRLLGRAVAGEPGTTGNAKPREIDASSRPTVLPIDYALTVRGPRRSDDLRPDFHCDPLSLAMDESLREMREAQGSDSVLATARGVSDAAVGVSTAGAPTVGVSTVGGGVEAHRSRLMADTDDSSDYASLSSDYSCYDNVMRPVVVVRGPAVDAEPLRNVEPFEPMAYSRAELQAPLGELTGHVGNACRQWQRETAGVGQTSQTAPSGQFDSSGSSSDSSSRRRRQRVRKSPRAHREEGRRGGDSPKDEKAAKEKKPTEKKPATKKAKPRVLQTPSSPKKWSTAPPRELLRTTTVRPRVLQVPSRAKPTAVPRRKPVTKETTTSNELERGVTRPRVVCSSAAVPKRRDAIARAKPFGHKQIKPGQATGYPISSVEDLADKTPPPTSTKNSLPSSLPLKKNPVPERREQRTCAREIAAPRDAAASKERRPEKQTVLQKPAVCQQVKREFAIPLKKLPKQTCQQPEAIPPIQVSTSTKLELRSRPVQLSPSLSESSNALRKQILMNVSSRENKRKASKSPTAKYSSSSTETNVKPIQNKTSLRPSRIRRRQRTAQLIQQRRPTPLPGKSDTLSRESVKQEEMKEMSRGTTIEGTTHEKNANSLETEPCEVVPIPYEPRLDSAVLATSSATVAEPELPEPVRSVFNEDELPDPVQNVFNNDELQDPVQSRFNEVELPDPVQNVFNEDELPDPVQSVLNENEQSAPIQSRFNENELQDPVQSVFNENELPAPVQSRFNESELPDPIQSVFNEDELPDPVQSVFNEDELPDPVQNVFNEDELPDPVQNVFNEDELPDPAKNVFNEDELPDPVKNVFNENELPDPVQSVSNEDQLPDPVRSRFNEDEQSANLQTSNMSSANVDTTNQGNFNDNIPVSMALLYYCRVQY